ncbi:MAG: hypothetical protein GY861_01610 [bacterium]|nr:hypothetical protein [bacterium]
MHQIQKILKSDPVVSKIFYKVVSSNMMPRHVNVPCALVANTDVSSGEGKHWVAFYIDKDRSGIYFDSYGNPPQLQSFKTFLKRNCRDWTHNKKLLQGPITSTCGQYCIYFLVHIARGYSMSDIQNAFEGYEDNDQAVTDFVNTTFDVNTEVVDEDFLLRQTSKTIYEQNK